MKRTILTSAIMHVLFFGLVHPGLGGQATEDQIRKLLNDAQNLGGSGQYAKALERVRPLAEQSGRFADKPELQYEVLDYEHFLLLKTGAFREALQTGFRIEELGRKIGDRKSPWDCLKIADAYLGLKEYDKALDWVEKAVKERGFAKLDTLQGEKFAPVREIPRFKALLADVESSTRIDPYSGRTFSAPNESSQELASVKQVNYLRVKGIHVNARCLTKRKAGQLIGMLVAGKSREIVQSVAHSLKVTYDKQQTPRQIPKKPNTPAARSVPVEPDWGAIFAATRE